MNIFVLDQDPLVSARYHCDKHVVKMILESAQMICTTHHLHPNTEVEYDIPYKKTHVNHPCNKWLRSSIANYQWLLLMVDELNNEYKLRYNRDNNHKSYDVIKRLPYPTLPALPMTRWARAMSDEFKVNVNNEFDSVVESYRNYYINAKDKFATWKTEIPEWYRKAKSIC